MRRARRIVVAAVRKSNGPTTTSTTTTGGGAGGSSSSSSSLIIVDGHGHTTEIDQQRLQTLLDEVMVIMVMATHLVGIREAREKERRCTVDYNNNYFTASSSCCP
eukprot:scaffold539_cov187-Ochromonas_danica.AAC.29